MNRYVICAFAVMIGLIGYASWVIKGLYRQSGMQQAEISQLHADAEAAQEQRRLDGLVLAHRAEANATAARKQASVRLSVDRALAAKREWADSTIPQEVLDALAQ